MTSSARSLNLERISSESIYKMKTIFLFLELIACMRAAPLPITVTWDWEFDWDAMTIKLGSGASTDQLTATWVRGVLPLT